MRYKALLSFLFIALLFGCGNDDNADSDQPDSPPPVNQPPSMNGGLVATIDALGLSMSWNEATDPENDDIQYVINVYNKNIGQTDYTDNNSYFSDITEYQHSSLVFNKMYKFEVYAKDNFDNISLNNLVYEFEYTNEAPSSVIDVIIEKFTSSVNIEWTASIDPDNDPLTYRIEFYQHTGFPFLEPNLIETFNTSSTSLTINNIEQLIKYSVNIVAIDAAPHEFESEPVQTCFALFPNSVYTGDIILRSQSDVDIFQGHNIQTVDGNIILEFPYTDPIDPWQILSSVYDFTPLTGIEIINGNLDLKGHGHHNLGDLNGFNQVHTINGRLIIQDQNSNLNQPSNSSIKDLSSFENLVTIGGSLSLTNNLGLTGNFPELETINEDLLIIENGVFSPPNSEIYGIGFPVLQTIDGNLNIYNNEFLGNITGLNSLSTIGGSLNISFSYHLENFPHLNSLNTIGGDIIFSETGLLSIPEMNQITNVSGDFELFDNYFATNFSGLGNLIQIDGDLKINNNRLLASITGMNNLATIQGSFIFSDSNSVLTSTPLFTSLQNINNGVSIDNSILTDLYFLQNITSLNFLNITNNPNLTDINNGSVNYLETLKVSNNDALTSLNFNNVNVPIATLVDVLIEDNETLTSLTGLNGFSHFIALEVKNNPQLDDLSGLNSVSEVDNCLQIYNNDSLENLDFLANLATINCGDLCLEVFDNGSSSETNNLVIKGNFNLGNFCGLTDFFTNSGLCLLDYSILENGYNPTHLDIIGGNCSF